MTIAQLEIENARLRKELAEERACKYRPIAEMHEDHGECVVLDITDAGYTETAHVCQLTPIPFSDVLEWATHFAPLPRLTHQDAERLIEEMGRTRDESEADGE